MTRLNPQQIVQQRAAVVLFIRRYRARYRYSPSYREIMAACGVSSTGIVSRHLDHLQAAGTLTHVQGQARTVVLTEEWTNEQRKAA